MDTLSWVNLATYKDAGREYLQRAYRDREAIVATDGHRLHMVKAPLIETPHYVDGFTGQEYVNYTEFNQSLNEAHYRGTLQIRKHDRAALKALTKMDSTLKLTFNRGKTHANCNWTILGVTLTKDEKKRGVIQDCVKGSMSAWFDSWFFNLEGSEGFSVALNGDYLVDAVMGTHRYRLYWAGETSPVYLINETLGHRAVIMPVRIP